MPCSHPCCYLLMLSWARKSEDSTAARTPQVSQKAAPKGSQAGYSGPASRPQPPSLLLSQAFNESP